MVRSQNDVKGPVTFYGSTHQDQHNGQVIHLAGQCNGKAGFLSWGNATIAGNKWSIHIEEFYVPCDFHWKWKLGAEFKIGDAEGWELLSGKNRETTIPAVDTPIEVYSNYNNYDGTYSCNFYSMLTYAGKHAAQATRFKHEASSSINICMYLSKIVRNLLRKIGP